MKISRYTDSQILAILKQAESGNCQRSCRLKFLNFFYEAISSSSVFLVLFFLSGFRVTTSAMSQLRVFFDQRSGFFSLGACWNLMPTVQKIIKMQGS